MFDGLLDVCLVSIYSFAKKDGAMRGRAEHAKKRQYLKLLVSQFRLLFYFYFFDKSTIPSYVFISFKKMEFLKYNSDPFRPPFLPKPLNLIG